MSVNKYSNMEENEVAKAKRDMDKYEIPMDCWPEGLEEAVMEHMFPQEGGRRKRRRSSKKRRRSSKKRRSSKRRRSSKKRRTGRRRR